MDPGSWEVLNRLLDEALELPAPERLKWIERLPEEYGAFRPRLRDLLSRVRSESFLGTVPKFQSVPEGDESEAFRRSESAGSEIGPYRLLREIGEGGMGTVWLAERSDGMILRPVALKLPRGSWRRALLGERMAREREILATLEPLTSPASTTRESPRGESHTSRSNTWKAVTSTSTAKRRSFLQANDSDSSSR